MDSKALNHPLGHPDFVKYPHRWLLQLNVSTNNTLKSKSAVNDLVKTARTILQEGEHLPSTILGHIVGVLLWSSYHADVELFGQSLQFLISETSLCTSLSIGDDPVSSDNVKTVVSFLKTSPYSKNSYLGTVLELLASCFDTSKPLNSCDVWKLCPMQSRKASNDLQKTVFSAFELFRQNKLTSALKILAVLVSSNLPCFQQIGLWNISVIIVSCHPGNLDALLLCSASFEQISPVDFGCQLVRHEVTPITTYQQLAYLSRKLGRPAACRNYCQSLQDIFSRSFISSDLKHAAVIYRNDLAYLSSDADEQQELLNKLQSIEVEDILEEVSSVSFQSRTLALCCVLLTQAFVCLDNNDLQEGYEYFSLSYQRSLELLDEFDSCYASTRNRYLGQLNGLHGYFLLLQGDSINAAIAYGVSYAHDGTLTLSLFNQCLVLIKLGKVSEASNNWKSAGVSCSDAHHSFYKLNLYFSNLLT